MNFSWGLFVYNPETEEHIYGTFYQLNGNKNGYYARNISNAWGPAIQYDNLIPLFYRRARGTLNDKVDITFKMTPTITQSSALGLALSN